MLCVRGYGYPPSLIISTLHAVSRIHNLFSCLLVERIEQPDRYWKSVWINRYVAKM